MKKIITILLFFVLGLVMISGCDTTNGDSDKIPQPPGLPEDSGNDQQQAGSSQIPSPPDLP